MKSIIATLALFCFFTLSVFSADNSTSNFSVKVNYIPLSSNVQSGIFELGLMTLDDWGRTYKAGTDFAKPPYDETNTNKAVFSISGVYGAPYSATISVENPSDASLGGLSAQINSTNNSSVAGVSSITKSSTLTEGEDEFSVYITRVKFLTGRPLIPGNAPITATIFVKCSVHYGS